MNMEETSEAEKRRIQNRLNKQKRRKERAEKLEQERKAKEAASTVNGEDPREAKEPSHEGPPEKKPRRKLRKPTAEEDIVDGFAILAFKSYDELTRAIQLGAESGDRKLCVQLLKRSQEGGDSKGSENKEQKQKSATSKKATTATKPPKPPKIKIPSPPKPKKIKELGEKMVNKVPTSEEKKRSKSAAAAGGNPKPPKKPRTNNGPSAKATMNKILCGKATETVSKSKISDGCSDLFATPRKDSSTLLVDNLHSPHEQKGLDLEAASHINHAVELKPLVPSTGPATTSEETPTVSTPSSTTSSCATISSVVTLAESLSKPKIEASETSLSKSLHTNGPLSSGPGGDLNGHNGSPDLSQKCPDDKADSPAAPVVPLLPPQRPAHQTLFTPYATSAITRVSTPLGPSSSHSVPETPTEQTAQVTNHAHLEASTRTQEPNHHHSHHANLQPLSDFTLSGSHIHRSSASPHVDKAGTGTGPNALTSGQIFSRNSPTPTGKVTPTTSKSAAFGSIARLLDSPNSSSTSRSSPSASIASATVTASTNHNNSGGSHSYSAQFTSGIASNTPNSYTSRSLSPRGHSPSRERESYSSNVSSLSRNSITPVSGSSSQLPPNLSPLQNLSYSKAASWLSSVPPGCSPVPRPTPPPPHSLSSGHLGLSHTGTTPSPHSVFPELVPGAQHSLPPHSISAMFAPPILPLSSIMSHPSAQSSPFGPASDTLFPGASASELVRRDLESRFLASSERSAGAPSNFMSRPGELHPHHALLSHLSGVNHLSPHNPNGGNPPPHSALFPPPLFKDMKLDSPFYRNLSISYPGFNGILPPPPNLATPFTPPSQLPTFTPKKSGRWNAMHVRIAWEIYQHQQKGGSGDNKSSISTSGAGASKTSSIGPPALNQNTTTSHSTTDLLNRPPNQMFPGLTRPADVGPQQPPFAPPLLSQHRPQFDPHQLFLHSQHLGPHMARYPGFGGLGPAYGGLSGLGSSLLSRDLSNLAALSSQEQWQRLHRGPPFPPGAGAAPGWQIPRPESESKAPSETRRHKEERAEKRRESSSHSDSKTRGDVSPFRDRSPIRPVRTPLENGDTDSRSSRSNDSHSTTAHQSKSRFKEDTNGDREKPTTPHHILMERDKLSHLAHLNASKPPPNILSVSHPSRLFHPSSPLTTPITTGWDSFPGLNSAPRMSSAESFRLSLLHLSEREREFSAAGLHPSQLQLRPPHYANGPFMNLPLGMGGPLPPPNPPGSNSNSNSSSSSTKSSPLGGPIPLLNPSLSHHHLHSSQNGPGSPTPLKSEDMSLARPKEDSR